MVAAARREHPGGMFRIRDFERYSAGIPGELLLPVPIRWVALDAWFGNPSAKLSCINCKLVALILPRRQRGILGAHY